MLIHPCLLFLLNSLAVQQVPAGTQLHIRLTTAIGSYASKVGAPVPAVLIAPVKVDGETILPAGSTISGKVKGVTRVGLGIRHETAGLELEFDRLTLSDEAPLPVSARVAEVDNALELVARDGRIRNLRATDSGGYRVSGYIRGVMLRCELHATIAVWLVRSGVVKVPEPEIYFPAGAELTLMLTQPLRRNSFFPVAPAGNELSDAERDDLHHMVAAIPDRTYAPNSHRPSDLTNVLLIGSHDQVAAAFSAAGWAQALPSSFRRRVRWLRAIGERRGFSSAPMSALLLNGMEPDMSWEKGFNDVTKRHHIRLWKQPGDWNGEELWIGAATRDINLAYLRPGQRLTHKIAADVDQEREKVAYDLAFTSCASVLGWIGRPEVPGFTENATGDSMTTDKRLVVVQLNDCRAPRLSTETVDTKPVPVHGGKWSVFARREILNTRSDLLRNNWYWRGYETVLWSVQVVRVHKRLSSGLGSFIGSFCPYSLRRPAVQEAAFTQ
jgi:hypothetical protein